MLNFFSPLWLTKIFCMLLILHNLIGRSLVTKSFPTVAIPWTVACQAPLSMGFSRQEYWSGLPPPVDLSDPGLEPVCLESLTPLPYGQTKPTDKPKFEAHIESHQ